MNLVDMGKYREEVQWKKKGALEEACVYLKGLRVDFIQHSSWHIKIRDVNYYPKKGSIYVDGEESKRYKRGLESLKEVLVEFGYIRDK